MGGEWEWWKGGNVGWRDEWRVTRGEGGGRHPLLGGKQRVRQMNAEVSVSRTGKGLDG